MIKNFKKLDKFLKSLINNFIGFLCFLMICISGLFIYTFIYSNFFESDSIQDVCLSCNKIYGYDDPNYSNSFILKLDKIKKNCGSSHITKKYGEDEYYIFKLEMKGDTQKLLYIPLEDCLTGDYRK